MITVVIPVLNESPTIQSVIEFALRAPNVTEVIVVDDGSIDGTPELAQSSGARVIGSMLLGKGASMQDGMLQASNEIVLYLDGDLSGLRPDLIERMTQPIIDGKADFTKARFTRIAGRVTVLTARPLIQTFFPELNGFEQPLGGIIAARRSLLRTLRFESDYGVDVGLLIDATSAGAVVQQVDIGHIDHDSQSLEALGDMAKQVVRVILDRAARYNRLEPQQLLEMDEIERQSQHELSFVLKRVGQSKRLALFDMDGTLVRGRFVTCLARRTNKMSQLEGLLDHPELDPKERTNRIAALFANVSKADFEETARTVPLMPGATELVLALRRRGYQVGIVSDSFRIATEIVRRRVYADFSIAHIMRFRKGLATGSITIAPPMKHKVGCTKHRICKQNVLIHLCDQIGIDPKDVIAVGDGDPDSCMLRAAGISFAFQPKGHEVRSSARFIVPDQLSDILDILDDLNSPHAVNHVLAMA